MRPQLLLADPARRSGSVVRGYAPASAARLLSRTPSGAAAPLQRQRAYTAIYAEVLRADRMCLCGMLAAEYSTLPKPMQQSVKRFFELNETWLATLLDSGRRASVLAFSGTALRAARSIVGSLEGAMLLARPYHDVTRLDAVVQRLLEEFSIGRSAPPARSVRPARVRPRTGARSSG